MENGTESTKWVTCEEAKNMKNGINVKGKIVDKAEIRTVNTKYGERKVCEAYLEDDSGRIKVVIWGEDAEKVKVGLTFSIEGGYTTIFRNEVQLNNSRRIGRAKDFRKNMIRRQEYQTQPLNSEQEEAVRHPYNEPLLVSAGPGSGKTKVAVERVKNLILKQGLNPREILCMTFTRAAMDEMDYRLSTAEELEGKYVEGQIRTFHSLCMDLIGPFHVFMLREQNRNDNDNPTDVRHILTRDGKDWEKEFKKMFTPAPEESEKEKQQGSFDDHEFRQMKTDRESLLQLDEGVSAWKTENKRVEDLEGYLKDHSEEIEYDEYLQRLEDLKKYFNAYNKYLKNLKKMWNKREERWEDVKQKVKDFDDFLQDTVNPVGNKPKWYKCCEHCISSGKYRRDIKPYDEYYNIFGFKLKHIIIDEFQDNNYLQFELAKMLTTDEAKNNITVVGDRNQSIYTFQGANPEIFNYFKEHYKDERGAKPKEIYLKYNYRSTEEIVAIANRLLKKDDHPCEEKHKESITQNGSGKKIEVREFCEEKDEYNFFLETIIDKIGKTFDRLHPLQKDSEITFGDFVIIARTNEIRKQISYELVRRGIPTISKKYHRLEYKKIKDGVIIDPGSYSRLLTNFLGQYPSLDVKSNISDFIEKLAPRVPNGPTHDGIANSKLEDFIDEPNALHYKVLYFLARNYKEQNGDKSLQVFSDYITNFTPKNPRDDMGDAVKIRTAHSVKGQQFPFVIVSTSYQRHFPLEFRERELKVPPDLQQHRRKKCMNCNHELTWKLEKLECKSCNANIEFELHRMEERRLYYVAITRAINELFITVPKKILDKSKDKDKPGEMKRVNLSQFLTDLEYKRDTKNIDWQDVCEDAKMSSEEIAEMDKQHKQQWENEFQKKYNEVEAELDKARKKISELKGELDEIKKDASSAYDKEKLEQRIQELEHEKDELLNEKKKHDVFGKKETSWEILEIAPDETMDKTIIAYKRLRKFWAYTAGLLAATPERKRYAEEQFKRITTAFENIEKGIGDTKI